MKNTDINENPQLRQNAVMPCLYVMMFSSGRTSAALAKYIKSNPKYENVIYVILNTGKEKEESLIFADKCDKEFGLNLIWLEAVINQGKGNGTTYSIVDFKTA
jgi:3'-phosphoadenosine 5'-phosphosulfate sulfotransferase (PAPS reductase)/FAD synthetase